MALRDAREVLVDDAAGADVQVAHLGVAHLARAAAPRQVPEASSVPWGYVASRRSNDGVRARLMALPGPAAARPSRP